LTISWDKYYELLKRREKESLLLRYVCIDESLRDMLRERGFTDSVIDVAMEKCIHKLLTPRDSRDKQISVDKFIYREYLINN
jgi:hypothetical protein